MTKRVLIAGAGVAAVEAVLALRHLAGRDFAANPVEHEAALEPTLLLADEDAAAAAFSGGILPAGYADRRAAWREQLDHDDRVGRRADG